MSGDFTVFCAGGGTGGHVYPLLAVIDELRRRGHIRAKFVWLGSRNGVERRLAAEAGISFRAIPCGKLRRYFSVRNVTDIFKVIAGFFCALALLAAHRPNLLFSKGGFVALPPALAARLLRVPVFTHESDFDPGLATRIISRFATRIFIPYEKSLSCYPARCHKRIVVSGNPVRRSLFAAEPTAGDSTADEAEISAFLDRGGAPLLLVLGGSLGAVELNRLVESSLDQLLLKYRIVHQTGFNKGSLPPSGNYLPRAYIKGTLPRLLRESAVVICRAGAGTLWENLAAGAPALLLPLRTGRQDQLRNADYFVEQGVAELFVNEPDGNFNENRNKFLAKIDKIGENQLMRERVVTGPMRDRALNAASLIAEEVEKTAKENKP